MKLDKQARTRLRALADAATKIRLDPQTVNECISSGRMAPLHWSNSKSYTPYIVAACESVPALLDEVERLEARLTVAISIITQLSDALDCNAIDNATHDAFERACRYLAKDPTP